MQISFKVQVSCNTFNHAPYIVDALNGFCIQETSFPFVCTIMDDASTDGEPKIILEFFHKHFDLEDRRIVRNEKKEDYDLFFARHKINTNCFFALLLLKYNHYSIRKAKTEYIKEWRDSVKYVALCEGDDYWVDPHKLQKQVDFLDSHSDYGMVCCASKIYEQGIGMRKGYFGHEYRGIQDLLEGNYFYNASVLKRKTLEDSYYQEIGYHSDWKMGDWPRLLHCAIVSKIGYIDEPMSVYRILPNSASHFDNFDKFRAFNENSVEVAKFFITKYKLDKDTLFPVLDNWLNRRLLIKACAIGNVDLVNRYKHKVKGLCAKERIMVFLCSHKVLVTLYGYNRKRRRLFR